MIHSSIYTLVFYSNRRFKSVKILFFSLRFVIQKKKLFSHFYFVRHPEARGGMLHNNGRVTVFDDRHSDDFQIFVLKNDLLIVLLLPQPERRGFDRRLVPSKGNNPGFREHHHEPLRIAVTLELF